ncbi:hypothetical protein GGQ73_001633 [Rhizobium skierniewicense]|uniref:Uncharacterized protein n=1 Tax=Rhizobium skierniewicense TaxID=984260 RepID=A0A7W6C4R1_9HYPH|nr:hypothetical protein [Rhizobium skierniewicense]MBB3945698.1 hypothetical protein [Rhizobium skierniewicense]
MLSNDRGIKFDWNETFCEITVSEDLGYILEVRQWWEGRYGYVIDKVHPSDSSVDDITIGQWHAPTETEARREAEKAFLRHIDGGLSLVQ